MITIRKLSLAAVVAFAALAAAVQRADAIPAFSMQTGLQCDACHTAMRATNDLGETYVRNDYRLPNLGIGGKPVVALRGQLAYTGEPDPSGLPKATVDEVEAFVAARVNREISVAGQFYITDGGRPGSTREAWVQYSSPGAFAGAPVRATLGAITLPLPVDPETFRQTNQHYAVFDQTVGANPFALIDPRNAASLAFGSPVRGPSATLVAVQGHDPHSGPAANGHRLDAASARSAGRPRAERVRLPRPPRPRHDLRPLRAPRHRDQLLPREPRRRDAAANRVRLEPERRRHRESPRAAASRKCATTCRTECS